MSAYVRNAWYVAAWSKEVGHRLTEHWLLDEPIVLYRTEGGKPVALGNRCPHRRYPLSKGQLVGDNVQCAYHGFTYAPDGACVAIPSQEHIPDMVRARRYPAAERSGWLWLWMGDPARADESLIPDCHWLDDPEWHGVGGTMHINCRYELMNDNLLDLSHLTFLHADTIGAGYIAQVAAECEVDGRVVRVKRSMQNVDLPPLHARTMGLSSPVDRWQIEEFIAPNYHLVSSGSRSLGDGKMAESRVLNGITPATRTSTTYVWAVYFSYEIEPVSMREAQLHLLRQDADVLEAQEIMVASDVPDAVEYNATADAGVVQGRRRLQELIQAEA
ncbi:MAG TPA: aromatic ring-hydroxylating dioxygenase subunit alpha [Chloroflexota bacterium]